MKAAFSLTTMAIGEEENQLNICTAVCQRIYCYFLLTTDKFLYLILLPLGVVTLGDKVAMRRAKSLKYLRKLFGQDLTKMKIPPIFKGKLSMLNKFQAPSHTFSTARLCCSSASLHQHNLDTRRRLGCQVSRSAEHNYTELLISLLKNCHKHQT